MKAVVISDTHKQHNALFLPKGDIIIHCGDISGRGTVNEVEDFIQWFDSLEYKYKIFIAGNHDFFFETEKNTNDRVSQLLFGKSVVYLNDSGIELEGIKFWGSPITPWFYNWAFNRYRGQDIQRHWNLIPKDVDVLITHGPPNGILDSSIRGVHCGCLDLLKTVHEIKPKYHLFGHIHEGYGIMQKNEITFINASVLDQDYRLVNQPFVIQI